MKKDKKTKNFWRGIGKDFVKGVLETFDLFIRGMITGLIVAIYAFAIFKGVLETLISLEII